MPTRPSDAAPSTTAAGSSENNTPADCTITVQHHLSVLRDALTGTRNHVGICDNWAIENHEPNRAAPPTMRPPASAKQHRVPVAYESHDHWA